MNGRVVVHAPDGTVRGQIVNLSAGGVLVEGAALAEGTSVSLELEIERRGWVRQAGAVRRGASTGGAIVFTDPPAAVVDVITSEVVAAQEAQRVPRVVVVDPSAPRRKRLAAALREAGCHSLEASTPLEAVDLLERSRVPVRAVAIAESTQTQTLADELVAFLAEAHPSLRLALIVDEPEKPSYPSRHPRCRLSIAANGATDLRDLVREFLTGVS